MRYFEYVSNNVRVMQLILRIIHLNYVKENGLRKSGHISILLTEFTQCSVVFYHAKLNFSIC